MKLPEDVRQKIREEVSKGKVVVIHPEASRKFRGARIAAIDYPR